MQRCLTTKREPVMFPDVASPPRNLTSDVLPQSSRPYVCRSVFRVECRASAFDFFHPLKAIAGVFDEEAINGCSDANAQPLRFSHLTFFVVARPQLLEVDGGPSIRILFVFDIRGAGQFR